MSFRLATTADLHYDVLRSRGPAAEIIQQINDTPADGVLLAGDTATADGNDLEQCLSLFRPDRPRLFLPGNHELWTRRRPRDVEDLLAVELPERITAAGWHWLPGSPVRLGEGALVGSPGWYDYAFAEPRLGLPRRFYEAKLSPAAARTLRRHELRADAGDVPESSRQFVARWNDGRFIQGLESDLAFLGRRMAELRRDLEAVAAAPSILAAVHVAPHEKLLPQVPPTGSVPADRMALAFTRAYLGSPAIGDLLLSVDNVRQIVCGHTHVRRDVEIAGRACVNVGSTYTEKRFLVLEL